jgi:hypothetical protein
MEPDPVEAEPCAMRPVTDDLLNVMRANLVALGEVDGYCGTVDKAFRESAGSIRPRTG